MYFAQILMILKNHLVIGGEEAIKMLYINTQKCS